MIRGYLTRLLLTLRGAFPDQPLLDERWATLQAEQERQRDELKARRMGPWSPAPVIMRPRARLEGAEGVFWGQFGHGTFGHGTDVRLHGVDSVVPRKVRR